MVDLKKLTRGISASAERVVVYGADGVGKSQFAAGAPDPFFLDANKGSLRLDVSRVLVEDWSDTKAWLTAVESGQVKCQTLVLDSLSDLEMMSCKTLFGTKSISEWAGGYGRGADALMVEWREVFAQLERIWSKGVGIIFTAHAKVKNFVDPTGPAYDRFVISGQENLTGFVRQRADFVLFCREEVSTVKSDSGDVRATTTGVRWAYTSRTPAFDAKARATNAFPARLPLSWQSFSEAVKGDAAMSVTMRKEIEAILLEFADKKLTADVEKYLKENPGQIVEARNRLVARQEEFRAHKNQTTNQVGAVT